MEKSVIEQFILNLKNAGIENFAFRFEGGNRIIENKDKCKLILRDDYVLGLETRNNHGAAPNANFNVLALPYDNIDSAKAFELTSKQLIDFLNIIGVSLDEDIKKFISTNGNRVSMGQRTVNNYYGEVHNEKGQVILTTPLPGRVTTSVTTDKEGVVEVDKDSPIL